MSTLHDNVKKLALDLTRVIPPALTRCSAVTSWPSAHWINAALTSPARSANIISTVRSTTFFFGFAEIKGSDCKDFVATGADDEAVAKWIQKNAKKRERIEIIKWNNEWRYKRSVNFPDRIQEFMEDYIPANVPPDVIRHIRYFFDIFDCEEKRFS